MTRLASKMIVIVAGVSGSGKTTVGALLAGRLHWRFADGDTFHLAASIAKMHAGIPLTDEDRRPWLRAITNWMDERIAHGESAVVTCSALKRAARDALLAGRPEVQMFFLSVDYDELARRLGSRHGHFFPEGLLGTQLRTLEPPQPDEARVTVMTSGHDPEETVAAIMAVIRPGEGAGQGESHEADA